ncbi:MAG: PQQ-binding-like beta-propeller repeat protein [Saprospiraceae bacterium]
MKLIKKLPALTNNIHIYKSKLFFTDIDETVTCININNYNLLWKGEKDWFYLKFTDDYVLNRIDIEENDIYKGITNVFSKDNFELLYTLELDALTLFRNNLEFVDLGYTVENRYGLYDFDNNKLLWQNERDIPYNAFIKGDYFYTLVDMRLEMIEAMTGKLMWSVSTEVEIRSNNNPQKIIDVTDGQLIMTYDYHTICAINIRNGIINWKWKIDVESQYSINEIFSVNSCFLKSGEGRYYYAAGRRLLEFDIMNRTIEAIVDTNVEIRGSKKQMMFHNLFLCGDKMCFYGTDYSKKLGAHYSTIGVFDMKKKKAVGFADDEFPGLIEI